MSMSNIVEEWNNARIRYQNRYYGACKKLKTGETNTDTADVNMGDGTMMNHNLIISKNAIEIVKGGGIDGN